MEMNSVQLGTNEARKKSGLPAPKRRRMKHLEFDQFFVRDQEVKAAHRLILDGRLSGSNRPLMAAQCRSDR